jgi:hypothetical protein
MTRNKIYSAVAGLVLSLGAASAGALTIQAGDYIMVLQNLDSGTTGYGNTVGTACTTVAGCNAAAAAPAPGSIGSVNPNADTMGIFSVQSITKVGDLTPFFTAGGADGFLTGVFGNLMDYNVTIAGATCSNANPGGCVTGAKAIGGTFTLYQNAAGPNTALGPNVAPGKDLNVPLYPTITGGPVYLSGVFSPGVIAGDTTTTFLSLFNNGTLNGGSGGYLDFTGGTALNTFNTNGQQDPNGNFHDAHLDVTFFAATGAAATAGWTVQSSAQITGAAVPEPNSIALLGLGMLAAGWAYRRRQSN